MRDRRSVHRYSVAVRWSGRGDRVVAAVDGDVLRNGASVTTCAGEARPATMTTLVDEGRNPSNRTPS